MIGWATKVFPLHTFPRILCGSEFSDIIEILSDVFSIDNDHVSTTIDIAIILFPSPKPDQSLFTNSAEEELEKENSVLYQQVEQP